MRPITRAALAAALAAAAMGAPVRAQAPPAPGDGSLFFNPGVSQWAFRAAGVPWICLKDARCVQIRFERVAPGQMAAAEVTALGFADNAYYLALRHAELAGGRQQAFRCTAETCAPSELPPGDFAFLGTYPSMQPGSPGGRTAILARAANAPERSRLLLCSDSACTEQPFTRDNRYDLTFMGAAPMDGLNRFWLRERGGNVFGCAPSAAAGDDRLECTSTGLVYPDIAAPAGTENDPQSAIAAVENAIRRGNWAEAERLIAEGRARFPAQPQWAQFEQRLTQLRAERDTRARTDQARRLVADARRYAAAGDDRAADSVLDEAARLAPGLAEIAQARADISRLRAERFRRFNERSQLVAEIERALAGFRLWEAEGLIAEGLRRFPNDAGFRNFEQRVGQMRAQAEWQGRLGRAARLVATAREAMNRQQFAEAERQLDAAEALAGGQPDIRAARADLARLRVEAEFRAADIRQFTVDIEAALARKQIAEAERMLDFAVRRHPQHPGWADLRRRIDQAKPANPPPIPTASLIADARAAIARKDWTVAERIVVAVERADPNAPAVKDVRRDLNAARSAAATQAQAFINVARAAIARKDWVAAERAVADAERADPQSADVQKVKADLAAAKAAPPAPAPTAALIADARAAMAKKDWADADRLIGQAEQLDRNAPAVKAARADLTAARNAAATQAQGFINAARAAIARKDWVVADRAVADAEKADPHSADVKKVKADLAAAKAAPPAPAPTAALIADARAAMAKKDWADADRLIGQAEQLDRNAPAVKAVRADLTAARNAAATQAQGFINAARAAIARKDWVVADRAVADAEKADPHSADVQKVKADLAAAKAAPPAPAPTAALIADARAAIAKKDWPAADALIRRAEGLDPNAPAVKAARADLTTARNAAATQAQAFIAAARAAIAKKDWTAAERAVADAEKADPQSAEVKKVKADLAAAKAAPPAPAPTAALIADARAAMAKKDWPAANRLIAQAERAEPNAPAVKAVRADFVTARDAAAAAARPFVNATRAAITGRNEAAAKASLAQAEAQDPFGVEVQRVKAAVKAAWP